MGCDIHLYVEYKKNDTWHPADKFTLTKNPDWGPADVSYYDQYYWERNYDLFAILAGVRNRHGLVPISWPKGLPEDCSAEIRAVSDRWGNDGHSHSHLTLEELLRYDWEQTVSESINVLAPEFAEWDEWERVKGNRPPGSTAKPGTTFDRVENYTMREIIASAKRLYPGRWQEQLERDYGRTYTEVEWREPYYKLAGSFWSKTMPRLFVLAMKQGVPYSDIRMVFWFDN